MWTNYRKFTKNIRRIYKSSKNSRFGISIDVKLVNLYILVIKLEIKESI